MFQRKTREEFNVMICIGVSCMLGNGKVTGGISSEDLNGNSTLFLLRI